MSVRIETRWTDDGGDGPPRFRVIVQGQDCGPSVPCSFAEYYAMEQRLNEMLHQVCGRSYDIGRSNAQSEMRRVLGVK